MAQLDITAPRAKLARARHFNDELLGAFEAYRASAPFINIVHSTDDIPGMPPGGRLFEHALRPMGLEAGLILGDAVHNMRTALDLLASELAVANGKSAKGVYFPFSDSAHELDDQIKRKNFRRAGDDAVKLLRIFEPYRGGNEPLRAIHDLDIQDKHRSLIIAVRDYSAKLNDLDLFQALHLPDPQVFSLQHLEFLFPAGTVLAGAQVAPTLENLAKVVDGVLEAFASLVAARGSK